MVVQWYYNCQELIDDGITMVLQLSAIDWRWHYDGITIARDWLTMVLQWYYNCQGLINDGITMILQLPGID